MLEAFFLWIYTPRAHEDGTVDQIIEEALAFPHPQSPEAFQRQLDAWVAHDTLDRLPEIAVPTLVVAGELDIATPTPLRTGRRRARSRAPSSSSCPARPTSRSRSAPTSSTPASTPSGPASGNERLTTDRSSARVTSGWS